MTSLPRCSAETSTGNQMGVAHSLSSLYLASVGQAENDSTHRPLDYLEETPFHLQMLMQVISPHLPGCLISSIISV